VAVVGDEIGAIYCAMWMSKRSRRLRRKRGSGWGEEFVQGMLPFIGGRGAVGARGRSSMAPASGAAKGQASECVV
jgi:hypothetical protein